MNKKRHISHGEVNLFEVDALPETAKKINPTPEQIFGLGFKIANSEQTGNHHLVKLKDAEGNTIELFEDKDGTLYIRNLQPTEISCVDTQRHDTVELPASTWKRKTSKEVDHLRNIKRDVFD